MSQISVVLVSIFISVGASATVEDLVFKAPRQLSVNSNNEIIVSYDLECNEQLAEVVRSDFKSGDKIQINIGVLIKANHLLDCLTPTKVETTSAGLAFSGIDYELVPVRK